MGSILLHLCSLKGVEVGISIKERNRNLWILKFEILKKKPGNMKKKNRENKIRNKGLCEIGNRENKFILIDENL